MTIHHRELIAELNFIVDRSFAIIDESERNMKTFMKAIATCADDENVRALGSYVAAIEEVRRLLLRARKTIAQCDEYERYLKGEIPDPRD